MNQKKQKINSTEILTFSMKKLRIFI